MRKKYNNRSKMSLLPSPSRKIKELSIKISFFCTLSTDHIKFQRQEASTILFYEPFGKMR